MNDLPWYSNGLEFLCSGCASCCYGFPGYVWLTNNDIEQIVSFLKIDKLSFLKKYTRSAYGLISLKEMSKPSYECIFLKDKKCSIYSARPFQCRAYPFWPQNLISEKVWDDNIKTFCPGSKKLYSKFYSFEEIEKIKNEYLQYKRTYYPS